MADLKISAAPPNPAPAGTDSLATNKAGVDFQTTLSQILSLVVLPPSPQGLGVWKYRTEIAEPPASGQIRFNNANISLATELYIAETNSGGPTDVSLFLDILLVPGAILYIQDKTVSANNVLVECGAVTDEGTYRKVIIANVLENGTEPSNNTDVIFVIGIAPSGVVEVNDLSAIVTWANVPDANVTEGSVTQHEAAINHDALLNFLTSEHFTQAAISIPASQISDFDTEVSNNVSVAANSAKVSNATHTGEVTGSGALAAHPTIISNKAVVTAIATDKVLLLDATDGLLKAADAVDFLAGGAEVNDLSSVVTWDDIPDANVPESAVTQHEAALTILESQITDGSILARVASAETISNTWNRLDNVGLNFGTGNDWSLFFNGADLQLIAAGAADPTSFQIFDAGGLKWELDHGNDRMWLRDGYTFRISSSDDTDFAEFSHDLTDFLTAFTTTVDWNITGLSGRIKQGAETLAFLSEIPAGGGDVFKVGTPLIDQIGVWTGDGTIKGFAGFEFDGSQLLLPDGAAGTPSLAFNSGGEGFWTGGVAQLNASIGGVRKMFLNSSAFTVDGSIGVESATGPRMLLEVPSATNPVINVRQFDADTGLGSVANGSMSQISDGEESTRTVAASAGGLQANNQDTGGGLERVLTESDLGAGGAVANNAVQARRTTSFTIVASFGDVTLDATDVETDAAVIEHDAVTDRIVVKETGTYKIEYELDIDNALVAGSDLILVEGRVRLNDAGTGINGSLASTSAFRDTSVGTGNENRFFSHLSNGFIANLTAADFVTLQLNQIPDTGGLEVFTAENVSLQVTRLL
jgi:hypothetical protein